jgi:hypothetical protein
MLAVGWPWDTRIMGAVASISPNVGGQVRLLLSRCFPSSDFLGYDSWWYSRLVRERNIFLGYRRRLRRRCISDGLIYKIVMATVFRDIVVHVLDKYIFEKNLPGEVLLTSC